MAFSEKIRGLISIGSGLIFDQTAVKWGKRKSMSHFLQGLYGNVNIRVLTDDFLQYGVTGSKVEC